MYCFIAAATSPVECPRGNFTAFLVRIPSVVRSERITLYLGKCKFAVKKIQRVAQYNWTIIRKTLIDNLRRNIESPYFKSTIQCTSSRQQQHNRIPKSYKPNSMQRRRKNNT